MSSSPRRVLTVVDTLTAGGAERVAVEVAAALDRTKWDPRVLVTRTDGPLSQVLIDADVPYRILGRTRRLERKAWTALVDEVRDADIVHSHKMGSNIWAALAGTRSHTPVVAHEHNFSEHAGLSRRMIDRYIIAPRVHKLVCVSESVAQVVCAHGTPHDKICVIPNGVRLQGVIDRTAAQAELGIDPGPMTIGIVGRLRPEKAHEVLIDAMKVLADRDISARAVIVGDGPCRADLEQQVSTLGIGQSIVFAGEHRDASRLAKAFDIGVISSHWEGLPLAALEIMAAGVPLVSTAVGGLVDLLDGEVGLLVPAGDHLALANALQRLATMKVSEREAMGTLGQDRVRDKFQFSSMMEQITAVYQDVGA